MTRRRFSLLSPILAFALVANSSAEEVVNIYSHRHYEADQILFDQFTEKTGIEVKVVKAGADQLIERLVAEGDDSPADLLVTTDAGRLFRAKDAGVLKSIDSKFLNETIPANLRDPDGMWYALTVRSRVIVYAKDRIDPATDLSTYEALAEPQWKNRVLARSSSNIYNQSLLASIIAADGSEEALRWAAAVRGNMARAPRGSDRDQVRAVAQGLGDVALANTYYLGLLATSGEAADRDAYSKVAPFFPNQDGRGAHVNVSGVGVTKSAKNEANAIKLIEFLASDEAQKTFAEANFEYPIKAENNENELLKSWGEFKRDTVDLNALGENNAEAVKVFDRAGWE